MGGYYFGGVTIIRSNVLLILHWFCATPSPPVHACEGWYILRKLRRMYHPPQFNFACANFFRWHYDFKNLFRKILLLSASPAQSRHAADFALLKSIGLDVLFHEIVGMRHFFRLSAPTDVAFISRLNQGIPLIFPYKDPMVLMSYLAK